LNKLNTYSSGIHGIDIIIDICMVIITEQDKVSSRDVNPGQKEITTAKISHLTTKARVLDK
jgi:hypothetical protein